MGIAVETAITAFAKVAATEVYKASQNKVGSLFSDGPLSRPLRKASTRPSAAFTNLLPAFSVDQDAEKGLRTLAQSPKFAEAVGQLPLTPFREIDTIRLREIFQTLGPTDLMMETSALPGKLSARRFDLAASESNELKNLIDLRSFDNREHS